MADPTISDPFDAAARVARGIAWLDDHDPGWWREDAPTRPGVDRSRPIDLGTLDMDDPCGCVLGHRYGDYYEAPITVETCVRLGFDANADDGAEWSALGAGWRKVITARRDAERARPAARASWRRCSMAERNPFCRDAVHVHIEADLARVTRERDEARRQRDDLREVAGEARADLRVAQARAAQLAVTLREVLRAWDVVDDGYGAGPYAAVVRPPTADDVTRWRAVLAADPDDPAPAPAPDRPDLLGAVSRLAEAVSALQQTLTRPTAEPVRIAGGRVRVSDGRRERWITDPLPGGWVCAEPDPTGPDGECGRPVESEPCEIHHPLPPDGPDR